MQPGVRNFLPGDPVPQFVVRASNNPSFPFASTAGRYVILSFLGSSQLTAARRVVDHIVTRHRRWLDDGNACFFGVSVDPADERDGRLREALPGIRYLWDFDFQVSRLFGSIVGPADAKNARYTPFTLVLDPMLRVLATIPIAEAGAHNAEIDRIIAALPPAEDHAGVKPNAPILLLPRLFEPEFCRDLIAQYEADGGHPSGFMREIDGKTTEVRDERHKRRRDFLIENGKIRSHINGCIVRRLVPAIEHAFQFRATRLERYLVACYDSDGGFFGRHRDNTTKGTAHRRFAVTVNLNAEDYEGGELVFPEFGLKTYRAPTGGAVVFSCSILHEATPVRRGRRFAFLPFLYDEAAAELREQNLKYLSGEVLDLNANLARQGTA